MMKRPAVVLLLALGLGAAILFTARTRRPAPRATSPLTQDAYVWQRAWTEPVRSAITTHGTNFAELIALKAEVSWNKGQPDVAQVPLDYPALQAAGCKVGLALRIGPFPGPFSPDDEIARWLSDLSATILAEAASNQLAVAEFQLDFDCAESKLEGYRIWVETIRRRIAPVPLTITTLPSWLNNRSFKRLIEATDGYVLQVHSLERPKTIAQPFTLCDPAAAKRAVERAGRMGVPFRVALPTYGYIVAFDREGRFIGLSAEGPARSWPEGAQLREVRADPQAMAQLVAAFTRDRSGALRGVIWYRLPIFSESLNWNWITLSVVRVGIIPHSDPRAEARYPRTALVEIDVINAGEADHSQSVTVALRWRGGRVVASDGLNGFEAVDVGPGAMRFVSGKEPRRLEPGQRRNIGWVRFERETEVQVEIESK